MNKTEAIEKTKLGWYSLIDTVYFIADKLPFIKVVDISHRHSMLQIQFEPSLDKYEQYVLDCIAYKIERDSVRICETCGSPAIRRKYLPIPQSLCITCYTLKYNEIMESTSQQVTPPDTSKS